MRVRRAVDASALHSTTAAAASPHGRVSLLTLACVLGAAAWAGGCGKPGALPQTAPVDAGQRQQAYDQRLEQERQQRVQDTKGEFEKRHGRDKVVTVTITGLTGDAAAADYYINRKLFKAAWPDYDAAAKRAAQATQANKQAAEQQAIQQNQQTWGGYGPGIIWYRYQPVKCDLPYPTIQKGTRADGTFVYHVVPVLNVDEFSKRFNIGNVTRVDAGGREVQVQSLLPDPVPDIDLEEMLITHGRQGVATIVVVGAQQDKDKVSWYLEKEAVKLDPKVNLDLVGPKMKKVGEFEMSVGPVSDLQGLAGRITFGSVTGVDANSRTITVSAKLPDNLPPKPTADELHAERMKAWNKPSDSDTKPRDGEEEATWALRVLKGRSHFALEAVLPRLKTMKMTDEEKKLVVESLIATVGDTPQFEKHLDALVHFQNPEVEKAIIGLFGSKTRSWDAEALHKRIRAMKFDESNEQALTEAMINNAPSGIFLKDEYLEMMMAHRNKEIDQAIIRMLDGSGHHHTAVIKAVARIGTAAAANALIARLGDFFDKTEARQALVSMGSKAEDPVLKLVDNPSSEVRVVAYGLLVQVGTEKSLAKLKSQQTKERDRNGKPAAKQAYEMLKSRLETEKAEAASEGDAKDSKSKDDAKGGAKGK